MKSVKLGFILLMVIFAEAAVFALPPVPKMPKPIFCESLTIPIDETYQNFIDARRRALEKAVQSPLINVADAGDYRLWLTCTSCGTHSVVKPAHDGRPSCEGCNNYADITKEPFWIPFHRDRERIPQDFVRFVKGETRFLGEPMWPCFSCGGFTPAADQGRPVNNCTHCGSDRAESDRTIEQLRREGKPIPSPFETNGLDRQLLEVLAAKDFLIFVGNQFLDPKAELRKLDQRRSGARAPRNRSGGGRDSSASSSHERATTDHSSGLSVAPARPQSRARVISHKVFARLATRTAAYIGLGSLLSMGAAVAVVNHLAAPTPPLVGQIVDKSAQLILFDTIEQYLAYTNPALGIGENGEVVIDPDKGWIDFGSVTSRPRVIDLEEDGVSVSPPVSANEAGAPSTGFAVEQFSVTVEVVLDGKKTQNPFLVSEEDYLRARVGEEVTVTFSGPLDPALEFSLGRN